MRRSATAVLIAFTMVGAAMAARAWQEPKANVGEFMRAKLAHAQLALEGLAIEDFKKIARGAKEMDDISQAAAWQVYQTPEYVQYSLEFRSAADDMRMAAEAKNLDGATLAYLQVTMKCVQCHKYVRNVRVTRADDGRLRR